MNGELNIIAWTVWILAVMVLPLTSRNPLYLMLLLVVVLVVFFTLPRKAGTTSAWRLFAYIGSSVALLSIGFNVLTVHAGDRVFTRLPGWLPIIGGPLTINALVYGIISATSIATVLFAAATYNSAIRHADLVRLFPGSLARFAVGAGIALLFVPQTITTARDIYDAQRARGHTFRRPGDARAYIVPLLSTGMERAILLGEALETRGFGSAAAVSRPGTVRRVMPVLAAISLLGALFAIGKGSPAIGMLAMLLAGTCAVLSTTARSARTRYRTVEWKSTSIVVTGTSLTALVILLFGRAIIPMHLAYDTFPRIDAPAFAPIVGVAILLLTMPALVKQP